MIDQHKVQLLPCPWCGNPPISHWVGSEDGGYHEIACDSCNPKESGAIAYMFCGVHGDDEDSCVERWNTRQAALAHASSATVKENLTVGEGKAVAWRYRIGGREKHLNPWVYQTAGEELVEPRPIIEAQALYTHPAPSAEDDSVVRKLRQWASRINNNGSYAERDLLLLAASMIEVSGAPSAEDANGWREMDSAPIDKAIMGAWFGSPDYTEVSPVIYCSERDKWMNPDDMRDDEYTKPDMWHPYPVAPKHREIDQALAAERGEA